MKKFINSPDTLLREALGGIALAHPDLLVAHYEPTFVRRAQRPAGRKVALISGGHSILPTVPVSRS